MNTFKGLIFAGIKFRGDSISGLQNPRNFIPAKIFNEKTNQKKPKNGSKSSEFLKTARNID